MKKILLLVLVMCSIVAGYAQTKQLKKMISSGQYTQNTLEFTYDNNGRMIAVGGDEECTITYTSDQILIQSISNGQMEASTYTLTNGLLTHADDMQADFYYDSGNRLIKWDVTVSGKNRPLEFIWEEGNITHTKRYNGTELSTELTYSYNNITTHPLIHCLWGGLDFLGWPDDFILYPYLGTLSKNLVTTTADVSGHGHTYAYEYEQNSDGDIVKIAEYYDGNLSTTYTFEWEPSTSGINSIDSEQTVPSAYYSVNGVRAAKAHHGLNIVRTANGKVRKYIAK